MDKHVSRWKGLCAHSVLRTPDLQTVNLWVTVTQHKGDCACPQHGGRTFSSQPRGLPAPQATATMEPPALAATGSGAAGPELGLFETLWKVPTASKQAAGCLGKSSTSLPSVSPKPVHTAGPPRGPTDQVPSPRQPLKMLVSFSRGRAPMILLDPKLLCFPRRGQQQYAAIGAAGKAALSTERPGQTQSPRHRQESQTAGRADWLREQRAAKSRAYPARSEAFLGVYIPRSKRTRCGLYSG